MSEQQLRDVLARVVPEPPDTVADASPIVRAARRRRRARVVGGAGLTAVLVAGTFVGVQAVRGDDQKDLVTDDPTPQLADPYTTAPCPDADAEWASEPVGDLDQVTAVRFCSRTVPGLAFTAQAGPADALVDDVSAFTAAVGSLEPADPMRCAATDPIPSDSRVLLLLADGTSVGVPAGFCQDAEVGGRTVDGGDVTHALLDALRDQRDARPYTYSGTPPVLDCTVYGDVTPAQPGHESLVAAATCSPDGGEAVALPDDRVGRLDQAWAEAGLVEQGDPCAPSGDPQPEFLAVTDHGDLVRLYVGSCDFLYFPSSDPDVPFQLGITAGDLIG